jgi:hypothetical protein
LKVEECDIGPVFDRDFCRDDFDTSELTICPGNLSPVKEEENELMRPNNITLMCNISNVDLSLMSEIDHGLNLDLHNKNVKTLKQQSSTPKVPFEFGKHIKFRLKKDFNVGFSGESLSVEEYERFFGKDFELGELKEGFNLDWRKPRGTKDPGSFTQTWSKYDRKKAINMISRWHEDCGDGHETLYLTIRMFDFISARIKFEIFDMNTFMIVCYLIAQKFGEHEASRFEDILEYLTQFNQNTPPNIQPNESRLRKIEILILNSIKHKVT